MLRCLAGYKLPKHEHLNSMDQESNNNFINHKTRAAKAWPILTSCAQNKATITYGKLSEAVGVHHRAAAYFLEEIQTYCADNQLPPLTILVINQKGELGAGFTEWITGTFEADKEIVFEYNWSKEANPFELESVALIKPLNRYEEYSRKQIHQIFSPDTIFTPQAGTWGLQGIVPIPDRDGDFVFFVTYGKETPDHIFDESVTTDGVLTWQSQPAQSLLNAQIQKLIHHDSSKNSIYLFLRTGRKRDYTYLGQLKYLNHDGERERPVHFQWQILDWHPLSQQLDVMGLELVDLQPYSEHPTKGSEQSSHRNNLIFEELPSANNLSETARSTESFRTCKQPDYASIQRENSKLGKAGELLVILEERRILLKNRRADLASKITHVSEVEGDGAGYDVLSYELNGEKKYIEVKTTKGSARTDFYISPNELAFSKAHADKYYLYRLYEFDSDLNFAKVGVLKGDLSDQLDLVPQSYRAKKL